MNATTTGNVQTTTQTKSQKGEMKQTKMSQKCKQNVNQTKWYKNNTSKHATGKPQTK